MLQLVCEAAFGLDQVLQSTSVGPSLRAVATTSGQQTLDVVTTLLPALRELTEVEIGSDVQLPDYREATAPPTVGLSSVAAVGSTDWFDLTVTVSVDGREVPFDQLFFALATDQQVMILADGISRKYSTASNDCRFPFKLAITGTPMENNLIELWALFSIVAPGLFPIRPDSTTSTGRRSRRMEMLSSWAGYAAASGR